MFFFSLGAHASAFGAGFSAGPPTMIPSRGTDVLDSVVNRLLVKKGSDWTSVILSEYVGLYPDSLGTFSLVWDKRTKQFVSHGSVFQSAAHPGAGLVAHIRTADDFKSLGLGTLVTEEVTGAAFEQGARLVVLATDDKLHRVEQGERAATAMYSKIGYSILAEKRLADTVDWLMVIDRACYELCQQEKQAGGGRFPKQVSPEVNGLQKQLVQQTRSRLGAKRAGGGATPVSDGDMASLFLLMNLCPDEDFRLKLFAWSVHLGPEFERTFITTLRQAIVDQDRLQDASLVLRDAGGSIVAVCAACQVAPFTRNTMQIDFYCLPEFLRNNPDELSGLVSATLERIQSSGTAPRPCRLVFTGIDPTKVAVFESLDFLETTAACPFFGPDGEIAFEAKEYVRFF